MSALAIAKPQQQPATAAIAAQRANEPLFDQTLADLQAEHNPQTTIEHQLCRQIAESWCRLQRTMQLESDLFNAYSDFMEIADALNKLTRYRTSIEREWHKCIDQLTKIQERRRKAEAQAQAAKPQPKPKKTSPLDDLLKQYLFAPMPTRNRAPQPEPDTETEIGFVSQNPESA